MTTHHAHHARTAGADVQKVAMAAGVVFLVVGVLGCIPGVTTGYEDLALAGHESGAELLGIFQVSVLHNLVHLLFGIAGVVAARTWSASRGYLVGGGLAYLVLWVYGQVIDHGTDANFLPLDEADNWLHLVLGLGMVGLGLALGRRHEDRTRKG